MCDDDCQGREFTMDAWYGVNQRWMELPAAEMDWEAEPDRWKAGEGGALTFEFSPRQSLPPGAHLALEVHCYHTPSCQILWSH